MLFSRFVHCSLVDVGVTHRSRHLHVVFCNTVIRKLDSIMACSVLSQVQLQWTCPSASWNGTYAMRPVVDGQPLYEADISTGLECAAPADSGPAIVTVQVRLSRVHSNCTASCCFLSCERHKVVA